MPRVTRKPETGGISDQPFDQFELGPEEPDFQNSKPDILLGGCLNYQKTSN